MVRPCTSGYSEGKPWHTTLQLQTSGLSWQDALALHEATWSARWQAPAQPLACAVPDDILDLCAAVTDPTEGAGGG